MIDQKTLGEELRRVRTAAGLTVAELSTRTRVREAYLAAIEEDREEPSAVALERIAQQLDPSGSAYTDLRQLLTAPEFDLAGTVPLRSPRQQAIRLEIERRRYEQNTSSTPAVVCAICTGAAVGAQFRVNSRTVCSGCGEQLLARLNADAKRSRTVSAIAAATAVGTAGTLVYLGILAATGVAFGAIAAGIGVMVGRRSARDATPPILGCSASAAA
jgi:transcriptional regulator with XRE-family HTH domain